MTVCRGLPMRNHLQNDSIFFMVHNKRRYKEHYEEIFNVTGDDVEFPLPFTEVPEKLEISGINLKKISLFT